MKRKSTEYEIKYYQLFVGKRIIKFEFIDTGEFQLPTFTFDDGTFAQVWADPEGNRPGHVSLHDLATGNELCPGA